jgi:hypothetical protein
MELDPSSMLLIELLRRYTRNHASIPPCGFSGEITHHYYWLHNLPLYSFSFTRTYLLSLPFSLPFGKNSTTANMPAMATLHSSPACHWHWSTAFLTATAHTCDLRLGHVLDSHLITVHDATSTFTVLFFCSGKFKIISPLSIAARRQRA